MILDCVIGRNPQRRTNMYDLFGFLPLALPKFFSESLRYKKKRPFLHSDFEEKDVFVLTDYVPARHCAEFNLYFSWVRHF